MSDEDQPGGSSVYTMTSREVVSSLLAAAAAHESAALEHLRDHDSEAAILSVEIARYIRRRLVPRVVDGTWAEWGKP